MSVYTVIMKVIMILFLLSSKKYLFTLSLPMCYEIKYKKAADSIKSMVKPKNIDETFRD